MNFIHGRRETSEYNAWRGMRQRCNNPNKSGYRHYGGRGIKCCACVNKYIDFYNAVGPKPSKEHSIDRIDNDGHYCVCKGNLKWSDRSQQQKNKRPKHDKA